MKRRSEHLVLKRDGRTEFLRATKLARSVYLALRSVGVDEDWRALEVSAAVLAGLRVPRGAASGPAGEPQAAASTATRATVLTTEALGQAVESVLSATGQAAAAVAYTAVASERARRRQALSALGRSVAFEGPADIYPTGIPGNNRLPKE